MEKDSVKKVKRNIVSWLAEAEGDSHQDDPPTDQSKSRKKAKPRTMETERSLTNKEVEGNTDEGLSSGEVKQLKFIEDLMASNQVALVPSPPTRGDGNCWFRALAEQVEFHNIPHKARNFRSLRLEVRSGLVNFLLV